MFNIKLPITPIDVFGSGHTPNSEPMKWMTKAVQVTRDDGRVSTWTILGRKDGSKGAFGIMDITDDEEVSRYSVAMYANSTPKDVVRHYRSLASGEKLFDIADPYYFDIIDEIQLGIWQECMEELKRFEEYI